MLALGIEILKLFSSSKIKYNITYKYSIKKILILFSYLKVNNERVLKDTNNPIPTLTRHYLWTVDV